MLSFPSVGATENILLAAVMADGITEIRNAAQEPEIVDLAGYLSRRRRKDKDAGKSTVYVEGVKTLHSAEYTVMPDRIVAATYLSAAAITGGKVWVTDICPADLESVLPVLEQAGCRMKIMRDCIFLEGPGHDSTGAQYPHFAVSRLSNRRTGADDGAFDAFKRNQRFC